jgi:hypothetical protein
MAQNSVCVVCYENEAVNTGLKCPDNKCRGYLAVCKRCDESISNCVYCHNSKKQYNFVEMGSSRLSVKMFLAIMYAGLIGHFSNICFESSFAISNRDKYIIEICEDEYIRSNYTFDHSLSLSDSPSVSSSEVYSSYASS